MTKLDDPWLICGDFNTAPDLARYVVDTSAADIPTAVIKEAKRDVINLLGTALYSAKDPSLKIVLDVLGQALDFEVLRRRRLGLPRVSRHLAVEIRAPRFGRRPWASSGDGAGWGAGWRCAARSPRSVRREAEPSRRRPP